jgi:hypothetical protein
MAQKRVLAVQTADRAAANLNTGEEAMNSDQSAV